MRKFFLDVDRARVPFVPFGWLRLAQLSLYWQLTQRNLLLGWMMITKGVDGYRAFHSQSFVAKVGFMSQTAPAKWVTKPAVVVLITDGVLTAALTVNALINVPLLEVLEFLPLVLAYVTVPGLVGVLAAAATRRFARWQQWFTVTVTVLVAMFVMGWLFPPLYPLETKGTIAGGMFVVFIAGPVYLVMTAVVAIVVAVITHGRARQVRKDLLLK